MTLSYRFKYSCSAKMFQKIVQKRSAAGFFTQKVTEIQNIVLIVMQLCNKMFSAVSTHVIAFTLSYILIFLLKFWIIQLNLGVPNRWREGVPRRGFVSRMSSRSLYMCLIRIAIIAYGQ